MVKVALVVAAVAQAHNSNLIKRRSVIERFLNIKIQRGILGVPRMPLLIPFFFITSLDFLDHTYFIMESMRYRDYKNFYKGGYYHIYNRGNNKQPIFLDDSDYWQFLKRLTLVLNLEPKRMPLYSRGASSIKPLPCEAFSVLAYCLMPNHFHFLIRQNTELGMNKLLSKVCTSYSIYFNKKYDRVGSLYQDQFKAKEVSTNDYLAHASAYIHNNPANPESYEYSSYRNYLNKNLHSFVETNSILGMFENNSLKYQSFVINARLQDYSSEGHLLDVEDAPRHV